MVRTLDIAFLPLGGKKTTSSPAHIVKLMRPQLTYMLEGESALWCLVFSFELRPPETVADPRPMAFLHVIDVRD